MSSGYIKPATVEDIVHLAFNIRKADTQECLASTGQAPLISLYLGFKHSVESYTGFDSNDNLVCIYGVNSEGAIWMSATPHIETVPMTFLKHSKLKLKELFNRYEILWNYVDARNVLHIKWLKWLGFTFINKHENYGYGQLPFYEFVQIRSYD